MHQDLQVRCDVIGDSSVVQADGEVDMGSVDVLETHLRSLLTQNPAPETVVLDLTGVGFFGTVGLSLLLWTDQCCREQAIGLSIVATNRSVLRSLEVTGLLDRFHILSTRPTSEPAPVSAAFLSG